MIRMKCVAMLLACGFAFSSTANGDATTSATAKRKVTRAQVERGRYLLIVGSCNDCHTAGFAPSDGHVAEKDWLLGSGPLGFNGPWGTTYAPNLRAVASRMTEAQWVPYLKTLKTRPPMPWFNLKQWRDSDLRALYQYIRQLGPVGDATVKAYLPPDKTPPEPFIRWPAPPK